MELRHLSVYLELFYIIIKLGLKVVRVSVAHNSPHPVKRLAERGDHLRRPDLSTSELSFRRVNCSSCGKTFAPLQRLLRLNQCQNWVNGLEKLVVDTAGETGYRRSVAIFTAADVDAPPFRIAHEWVLRADFDKIDIQEEPCTVFADGTVFKGYPAWRQGGRVSGMRQEGNVRLRPQMTQMGAGFPEGVVDD